MPSTTPSTSAVAEEALSLDHFQVGEQGKIASLQADTDLKQRLSALGLREGVTVQVLRKASFGGPMHVRIGTTELIMRLNEAKRINAMPLCN